MHLCKFQQDNYGDPSSSGNGPQCGLCERREPTAFSTETGHPFNSGQGQDGRGVFERGPPWHRYVKLPAGLTGSAKFQSWAEHHSATEHTTLSFKR
eukprot:scaffold9735_cov54-Phaeocystis_antarctica.AAC.1